MSPVIFILYNLISFNSSGEFDYELSLRTDLYTEKHTQWFYFRVRNTRAGVRYRFTITNLLKVGSYYHFYWDSFPSRLFSSLFL